MARKELNHKSRGSDGTACMDRMSLMDTGQYTSDEDDENMTSSGMMPLLFDVENAESKASEIRRVNLMNLLMMSAVFLLQNAAFPIYYDDVITIWQSPDLEQWWFISKSCFFGSYLFSCLLAPLVCDRILNIKLCLLLGSLSTSGVVLAQLIPHSYTLIPASGFAGLMLPLYFTSQGIWLTTSSHKFACPLGINLVNHSPESSMTLFHVIFHFMYLSGPIWRSLLNLVILDDSSGLYGSNGTCGFEECSIELGYNNGSNSYRIFRFESIIYVLRSRFETCVQALG